MDKKENEKGKKTWRLIWRWSLFSVAIMLFFWLIWFLIAGKVPVFNQIKIENFSFNKTFVMPFEVSRWWDLIAIIVWPIVYIFALRTKRWGYYDKDSFIWFNGFAAVLGVFILGICGKYLISLIALMVIFLIYAVIIEFCYSNYWNDIFKKDDRGLLDLKANLTLVLSISMSFSFSLIFNLGLVAGLISAFLIFLILIIIQFFLKMLRPIGIPLRALGRWLILKKVS